MSRVPHPSLCALYRATAPLRSLAARFRGADDASLSLRRELADPWLRPHPAWEALANDAPLDTPLRRALARLANHPPRRAGSRRGAVAPAEFTETEGTATSPRPPRVISRDNARRVADILAASMDQGAADAAPAPARRAMPRPAAAYAPQQRRAVANKGMARHFSNDTEPVNDLLATARARGWTRFAMAETESGRSHAEAAAVSGLLANGRLGRVSLAGLTARITGDDAGERASQHLEPASPVWAVAIQKRVDAIEERRRAVANVSHDLVAAEAGPAARRRRSLLEPEADDAHVSRTDVFSSGGAPLTGLRRLAAQTGAQIRRLPPEHGGHSSERRVTPGRHLGIGAPQQDDDDNLSRRLADILRREAIRYGIDTGGADR